MFWPADQFFLNFKILRGLAALGDQISPHKQLQKQLLAKLLLAQLLDPRSVFLDTTKRTMYIAEIRIYCPDLFKQ